MKKFLDVGVGLAVGLTLVLASPAYPHGGGVIRLASKQVAVGGTIALTGRKLEKNADLKLELRGILDNYPAGRIHSDVKGNVSAMVTIPPAIPVGVYTLVAIAEDGDVAARTEVVGRPRSRRGRGQNGNAAYGNRDARHGGNRGNDENRAKHHAGGMDRDHYTDPAQPRGWSVSAGSLEGNGAPLGLSGSHQRRRERDEPSDCGLRRLDADGRLLDALPRARLILTDALHVASMSRRDAYVLQPAPERSSHREPFSRGHPHLPARLARPHLCRSRAASGVHSRDAGLLDSFR